MISHLSRSSLARIYQGRRGKISEDIRRLGTIDGDRGRLGRTGMITGETVDIGDGRGLSGTMGKIKGGIGGLGRTGDY